MANDDDIISTELETLGEGLVSFPSHKPKAITIPHPEELVKIAREYFRWLCEQKNERLAIRRFDDKGKQEEINGHLQFINSLATFIESKTVSDNSIGTYHFVDYEHKTNLNLSGVNRHGATLKQLIYEAELQFHLIYCDILACNPVPQFQYPLFEGVWVELVIPNGNDQQSIFVSKRNPTGRPGIDWNWLKHKFVELEESGELPFPEGAWRTDISFLLQVSYANEYIGSKTRKVPQMATIRDEMKPIYDTYQIREKQYIQDIPNRRD